MKRWGLALVVLGAICLVVLALWVVVEYQLEPASFTDKLRSAWERSVLGFIPIAVGAVLLIFGWKKT